MKKLLLIIPLFIGFMLYVAYDQAVIAYRNHIMPSPPVTLATPINDILNSYAEGISAKISPDNPVVMLVPLNGFPDGLHHPSFKNAQVALEILKRVRSAEKYLILSEGYTGNTCMSGAQATAFMLSLNEGYDVKSGVHIVFESHARTTLENITNTKKILVSNFQGRDAALVVAGMSDPFPLANTDVGHGARAYMFARQNYGSLPYIHVIGLLPTNQVDSTIGGYSHKYNSATMFLGANGLLGLPFFNRKSMNKPIENCPDAL